MSWLIPDSLSDATCRRHGWWLLLGLTALLYLPGLGTLPLMDRDEPRFARATVEMMERGSWGVPYFNSDPGMTDAQRIAAMQKGKGAMEVGYRFDKPPLTYWWMRLHYALLGVNEFAARLHTVLAVWLVAWVVCALGDRLAGARAGLAAGVAWITTFQVLVHGRLCVADMPLVLFVTTTCWALIVLLFPERGLDLRDEGEGVATAPVSALASASASALMVPSPGPQRFTRWHGLLYVSLGLGFLAKGPIAWLVPGLAVVLWRYAFWRKRYPWGGLKLWPGALITLGLVVAWGLPALVETQGMFWKVGMGEHVVKRGTTAFNGRFPIPGYYLAMAVLSLFPWIALLPQVWTAVRAQWDARRAFLVSWLVAPYVIFSLYATQLPHYVMPGFPAAMMLLMCTGDLGLAGAWGRVLRWGCPLLIGVPGLALLALGQGWLPRPLPLVGAAAGLCGWLGLFLLCLAGLGALLVALSTSQALRRFQAGRWVMMPLCVVAVGVCLAKDSALLRGLHPAVQLAGLAGPLPAQVDLVGWQFQEPSLVFHFHHHWRFPSKLAAVQERMARPGARVVVLLRREWTLNRALQEVRQGKARTPVPTPTQASMGFAMDKDFSPEVDALIAAHPGYEVREFTGLNAARSSWVELRMLVRR